MNTTNSKQRERLRLTATILGVIGVVADMALAFVSCLASFQSPWSLELAYSLFSWLVHLAVLLVAGIWPFIGGVLLILDSSLLATFFFVTHSLVGLLGLGLFLTAYLPLLASGVLFLLSWREGRRHPKQAGG